MKHKVRQHHVKSVCVFGSSLVGNFKRRRRRLEGKVGSLLKGEESLSDPSDSDLLSCCQSVQETEERVRRSFTLRIRLRLSSVSRSAHFCTSPVDGVHFEELV